MYAVMLDSIADAIIADAMQTLPQYTPVLVVAYVVDNETGEPMALVRTIGGEECLAHLLDMVATDANGHQYLACARAEVVGEED